MSGILLGASVRIQASGGGGTIGPVAIAANGDNGCIAGSNFTGGVDNDQAYMGRADSAAQVGFYRFVLPSAIPNGSTISSATMVFQGTDQFQWDQGVDDLTIRATDSGNAAAPTVAGERLTIDGGSTVPTTAVVTWSNITWNTAGDNTSADIASVIQELVTDNSGLASGAGIVLWVRGTINLDHYAAAALLAFGGNPTRLNITFT